MIDQAYAAVSSVNPNILIFAQGIGGTHGSQDGTPETKTVTPHGDPTLNPNWGENLFEAGVLPPTMPKSKLVYSPHTYGPSVHQQSMFADPAQPECVDADGDVFAEKKCQIVINQPVLDAGWAEHFGYLKAQGYAVAIGEFGGNMDWPDKTSTRNKEMYSYLTDRKTDEKWQNAFVDYLMREGIHDSFYWSINPESADTYGVFSTTYDPVSNSGGWGTWGGPDPRKTSLLAKLWNAPPVPNPGHVLSTGKVVEKELRFKAGASGSMTYSLPREEFVSLKLYGLDGRLRADVIGRRQAAGTHTLDRKDMGVEPGLYLAVFKAGASSRTVKVHLDR
jgi:hypothetical protein